MSAAGAATSLKRSAKATDPDETEPALERPSLIRRASDLGIPLGYGQPLEDGLRADMGRRFGFDFGAVRVYTSGSAAQTAAAMRASAYTVGHDTVFAHGRFAGEASGDRQLLAHELAHVLQQARAGNASSAGLEAEAGDAARDVGRDTPARVQLAAPLGVQCQQEGRPIGGQVSAVVGARTSGYGVAADVTIAANQTLPSPPGKTIHTSDPTHVHVSVTTTGLSISFDPYLIITKHLDWVGYLDLPIPVDEIDVDVWVHKAEWSWADNTLSVEWTARNIVNWVGDPGGEMLTAMQKAINGLPGRMKAPGYNPFADPDLPAELASFAARIGSSAQPGVAMPAMSGASITGSFDLAEELIRPVGSDVSIVVPAGTHVTIPIALAGVPTSPADLRIASVSVLLSQGARINLRALGRDWPVVALTRATFEAGHLSFGYTILHEDIGTSLLELLAAMQVQNDPLSAARIRDDLRFRDQAAHQQIDKMVQEQLEPMLRDLIVHNRGAIPGLDLRQVLGVEDTAAPAKGP